MENKDIDLILYNTIFEAKKDNGTIFNDYGEIKTITNITEISNEFLLMKKVLVLFSYCIDETDILYDNMIASYINYPNFDTDTREDYVLGRSYIEAYEPKIDTIPTTETQFNNIVQQRWRNYKNYLRPFTQYNANISVNSLFGIVEQTEDEIKKLKNDKQK